MFLLLSRELFEAIAILMTGSFDEPFALLFIAYAHVFFLT